MSGGGLKAGDVYVVVTASIGEFQKGMKAVLEAIEKTAKEAKKFANDVGEIGAILGAGFAGSLALAAQASGVVSDELQRLKDAAFTFGATIGEACLPYLKKFTDFVEKLVGWFQNLSPSTQDMIAKFLAVGAAVGASGLALGKVFGLIDGVAGAFNYFLTPAIGAAIKWLASLSVTAPAAAAAATTAGAAATTAGTATAASWGAAAAAVWAVLAPLLAIAAAVAAVILLVGALYKWWNTADSGLRKAVLGMLDTLKGWGASIVNFFKGLWAGITSWIGKAVDFILDKAAFVLDKFSRLSGLARKVGLDGIADALDGFKGITGKELGAIYGSTISSGVDALKDGLATAWDGFKFGAQYAWDGAKDAGSDFIGWAKKQLGDLFNFKDNDYTKKGKRDPAEVGKSANTDKAAIDATFAAKNYARSGSIFLKAYDKVIADKARAAAEELAKQAKRAVEALGRKLLSALGDVGSLIETGVQGFAAGGPIGAIAAVAAELLAKSEAFGRIVAMLNGFVQFVADVVGTVLLPVLPTLAAVLNVAGDLLRSLTPALQMFLAPVGALAPVVQALAILMRGLGPVIAVLTQIIVAITNPLTVLAGPVMKALFGAVRIVALGILYVVKGIGGVWNGIVSFVQGVFRTLAKIPLLGGVFDDAAKGLDSLKLPMDQITGAIADLQSATYDQAAASAAASEASWSQYQSAKDAAESLSNVPDGFKIALARFDAQDAVGTYGGTSPVVPSPAAPVATDNSTTNVEIYVDGATDPAEVARQVRDELRAEQRRRRGTGELLTPRFA